MGTIMLNGNVYSGGSSNKFKTTKYTSIDGALILQKACNYILGTEHIKEYHIYHINIIYSDGMYFSGLTFYKDNTNPIITALAKNGISNLNSNENGTLIPIRETTDLPANYTVSIIA